MELLVIVGLLIFAGSIHPLFSALFVSILRTDFILYTNVGASVCRLIVGILLVLAGLGAFGIAFGYLTLSFVSLVVYLLLSFRVIGLSKPIIQRSTYL